MLNDWYDKEVREYRNRKPNCKWCKYYSCHAPLLLEMYWQECRLKDKMINETNIRAKLCRYYKQKEYGE